MSKDIVLFVDNIGRALVGQQEASTAKSLSVRNPAIVNVNVAENGQISVQLFPFVFREFLAGKSREDGVVWKFNKATIIENTGMEVDDRLTEQYTKLFIDPPPEMPAQQPVGSEAAPEVVKLFDDEDEDVPTVEAEPVSQ
jgi:hypothetical protein